MSSTWLEAADFSDITTTDEVVMAAPVNIQSTNLNSLSVLEEQPLTPQTDFDFSFPKDYRVVEVKKFRLKK